MSDLKRLLVQNANQGILCYRLLAFIKDADNNWVNFSDQFAFNRGTDRLLSIGSISVSVEKTFETLQGNVQTAIFDNSDGFFDRPLTDLNIAGYGSLFTDVNFDDTENSLESVLIGRQIQICVLLTLRGTSTASTYTADEGEVEIPIGTYIIDDIMTSTNKDTASFRLRGLQTELAEVDASKIKCGTSWYANRPASFLVEEIVKLKFRKEDTNEVPDGFNISRVVNVETIDDSLVPAILGQPPQFDGTAWRNDGLLARALVWRGSHLYAGCDDEIWKYNPTEDLWTVVDNSTLSSIFSGIKVCHLETSGTTIYGVALASHTTWNQKCPRYYGIFFRIQSDDSVHIIGTTDVLSGLRTMRCGRYFTAYESSIWFHGHSIGKHFASAYSGEGLSIPFAQEIIIGNDNLPCRFGFEATADNQMADIWTTHAIAGLGISTWTDYAFDAKKDFYVAGIAMQTGIPGKNQIYRGTFFSMGQGFAFALVGGYYCYFLNELEINESSFAGILMTMNVNTGSTNLLRYFGIDGTGVCLTKYDSNNVLVCHMEWQENAGENISRCYISIIHIVTGSFTLYDFLGGATWNDQYWTAVDLLRTDAGYTFAILYNRALKQYALVKNVIVHSFSSVIFVKQSHGQLKNLYHDSVTNRVYAFEVGSGKIIWTSNDYSNNVGYLVDGDAIVDNEGNMLSNFASNPTASSLELYGISAPSCDPFLLGSIPIGKYVLFRLSNQFGDRIELADFEEMNGWQAIVKISQATTSIAGFDANGNFFFRSRDRVEGTADYTIGEIYDSSLAIKALSISKSRARSNVFNVCKIIPGSVRINPPEAELHLVPRETEDSSDVAAFCPFEVEQRDNYKKVIELVAVTEGEIGNLYTKTAFPLFKFAIYREEMELVIKLNYSSGNTILYVNSIFGAYDNRNESVPEIDDWVLAHDSSGVIHYSRIAGILETIAFQIWPTFSFDIAQGSIITVVKSAIKNVAGERSTWSDEGVTYTTQDIPVLAGVSVNFTVDDISLISVGCRIAFGELENLTLGQTDIVSTSPVVFINESTNSVQIVYAGGAIPAGTKVRAYYSPWVFDVFREVGGSNIWLKWPTAGSGEDKSTKEGDRIRVDCPGLTLNDDASSKQVAVNLESVASYGRREYSSISNSFLTRRRALEFARVIISLYKNPRYIFEVTCPIIPFFNLVTPSGDISRVDLYSPQLLPTATGNMIQCQPMQVQHDLKKGITKIRLRALSAY